ncbi:hypothetical protein ACPCKV_00985 [Streptomyces koyangensis]|uniref:hypothetical protein n=1 Tax=Streptomyces koyangensis TaxID=188770 RepID=UPI003C30DE7F
MSEDHRTTAPPGLRRALVAAVAACLVVGAASFAVGRSTAPETAAAAGAEPVARQSAVPCQGGTYTWFGVREEPLLTGVSRASQKGEETPLAAVARPRKAVDAPRGAGVDTRRTLHSLALHIGEAELDDGDADKDSLAFADPSRPYDLDDGGVEVDGDGVGTVEWAEVTTVTGQFRLECGDGRTVHGQAESWTVDGAGVLDCQEPLTDATSTARDAALLACGGDEPANTGGKPEAPEGARKTS